jgi:hypothetical protein
MRTRSKLAAVAAVLVILGAAAVVGYRSQPTTAARLDPSWRSAQANLPAAEGATGKPLDAVAPVNRDQAKDDASPSLSRAVQALAASKDPVDAFKAAQIMVQCRATATYVRQVEMTRLADRTPQQAEDLKSGALDAMGKKHCGDLDVNYMRAEIVPLLERAAAAGVLHAATALTLEGPFGNGWIDVDLRPSDPLVSAWKKRMGDVLTTAAAKGDWAAMSHLASNYGSGDGILERFDPTAQLRYTAAYAAAYEKQTGKKLPHADDLLQKYARRLPPDQAKTAIAEGLQIAAAGAQK